MTLTATSCPPPTPQRLGELLREAHLVTEAQLQVALYDQQEYSQLRLGEIFVARGWINQRTADFFADEWGWVRGQSLRKPLGAYLHQAGLMDTTTVEIIVQEQRHNGFRFGANAVLLGCIDQQTLDYFLEHLFPEEKDAAPYVFNSKQTLIQPQSEILAAIRRSQPPKDPSGTAPFELRERTAPKASAPRPTAPAEDADIAWIG
ncbi:hypothetical protein [Lyngbya confervoides]|uniref:DUF4388 domain-containing protein n=1 Tax=Lyngbya confervoides BDU141951 TaxID=1574623 RepID=A0ABD4T1P5_9CYAN|nr:hypothetical protein [Lyngbya confervoides]MCM1982365.1 hypothetical protein [Lyngbya confervoides BDU141951]